MIFEESRYETARVVPLAASDGVYRSTILPRSSVPTTVDYTLHLVEFGDRLDTLAFQAYGDAEFWWKIADANPEVFFPDDIVPGMLIRIPVQAVDI